VNTHHHLPQTLTRNVPRVQEAPLFRWLVGCTRSGAATTRKRRGWRRASAWASCSSGLHDVHRSPLPLPPRARAPHRRGDRAPATSASASIRRGLDEPETRAWAACPPTTWCRTKT
jgi:hypothetical protein